MPTVLVRVSLFFALSAAVACSSNDAANGTTATAMADAVLEDDVFDASSGYEPTASDISNYKLNMNRMRKYASAMKGFASIPPGDSAVLEAMSSGSANESTAQMIARIEATPVAMRILRESGLSAKDYVWITAAYIQAAMTEGILASNPNAKMPESQSSQNVEFLKANRAELESMMREAGMTQ